MASTGGGNLQTSGNLGMYFVGLTAIVVLGPIAFIHLSSFGASYTFTQIIAMTWTMMVDDRGLILMTVLTRLVYFFGVLLVTFPRLIFVYMINRLYSEKTTRKRVVRTGIISEIWLPATYYIPLLLQAITSPGTISGIPIAIPIPILLIAGLYMLRKKPTKGLPSAWAEAESSEDWWEESK